MSIIKKLWKKIIYAGGSYLRKHEADAIQALYEEVSDMDKNKLKAQLKRLDLVQRYPDGRTVVFYDLDDLNNEQWPEEILF